MFNFLEPWIVAKGKSTYAYEYGWKINHKLWQGAPKSVATFVRNFYVCVSESRTEVESLKEEKANEGKLSSVESIAQANKVLAKANKGKTAFLAKKALSRLT